MMLIRRWIPSQTITSATGAAHITRAKPYLNFMDIAGNLNGFITRMLLLQMGRWGDKSTMTVQARKPESIACCFMRLRVKPITRNDEKKPCK